MAMSAFKRTVRSVGKDRLLWVIYGVTVAATIITETETAWLFLAAGVTVCLWRALPRRLHPGGLNG